MGPLASRGALDELEEQVDDATARGARLLMGGKRRADSPGNFFEPTLLADVPNDAVVMQEESFGPLVPVAPVDDDNEAIARMNDTHYGLTASVWTRDAARAERFGREVQAGTIYQNRCDFLDPALEHAQGRGIGQHDTGSLRSHDSPQCLQIDVSLPVSRDFTHLVTTHGRRGRVGPGWRVARLPRATRARASRARHVGHSRPV